MEILPDAWYAMHSPAIYPRNQGYLGNGDCPESRVRMPAAGTDALPGLPMGNGAMEDGRVP